MVILYMIILYRIGLFLFLLTSIITLITYQYYVPTYIGPVPPWPVNLKYIIIDYDPNHASYIIYNIIILLCYYYVFARGNRFRYNARAFTTYS